MYERLTWIRGKCIINKLLDLGQNKTICFGNLPYFCAAGFAVFSHSFFYNYFILFILLQIIYIYNFTIHML